MSDFLNCKQQPPGSHYIHGEYVEDASGESFATLFPADQSEIARLHHATPSIIEQAISSAEQGQRQWAGYSAEQRSEVLQNAARIIREDNEALSQLETLDTGKPIQETRVADAASGADCLAYFAALVRDIRGDYIDLQQAYVYTRHEPLGVCLGIGAWNYPMQIACWKSAPALACGNAMIFKPSEITPLTTLKLAEIYRRAGLPKGVFNVVQGEGAVAQSLLNNPAIEKVSLTGSSETGKRVMASAANGLKSVSLELGGKSPLIIFDDADIDKAVSAAMLANFYSAGQVCTNGTRVFVHESVEAVFLERLLKAVEAMRLGDPRHDDTEMGPLISARQFDIVMSYLKLGVEQGAKALIGGNSAQLKTLPKGHFVEPTVFVDVEDDMRIAKEEIFGPVMSVLRFKTEQEVIERANQSQYGLAAGVITENLSRAQRVIAKLQAGTCWVNCYNLTPIEMPFGGVKLSGMGRENGRAALDHYSQTKSVYVQL